MNKQTNKKKQVLNVCYLPCCSKFLYSSPHLFQRRDQCNWLGNSNAGQIHLICVKGDHPTHLCTAPNLFLAKASCLPILFFLTINMPSSSLIQNLFRCCSLCLGCSLSRSSNTSSLLSGLQLRQPSPTSWLDQPSLFTNCRT
uniref:Uncharacterized protein n=1 Tax=Molossus molossus TaxID=27622 RepID=A0A7J8F906_MOLMO|nr:hypothetical protein HJG59_008535 [Molossus molossus]